MKALRKAVLLAAAILLLTVGTAGASTIYRTSGTGTNDESKSTVYAFYADVTSSGATITFSQTKGHCVVNYVGLFDYEWGCYHLQFICGNTRYNYEWNDVKFNRDNEYFTVAFPSTGTYEIRVIPYSDSEINDAYAVTHFNFWDPIEGPEWKVDSYSGCTLSTTVPQPNYPNANVTYRNYIDGMLASEQSLQFAPGTTNAVIADDFGGCYLESQTADVITVNQYGVADTYFVNFYYRTITPVTETVTVTEPPATKSYGIEMMPEMYYMGTTTITQNKTAVYTGPGSYYYRTASGKARVDYGESVDVYGAEGGWILISYTITEGSRKGHRFSFASAETVSGGYGYPDLETGYWPITIRSGAKLIDEPNSGRSGYSTISLNGNQAYALAKIHSDGKWWVYFEADGYSDVDHGNRTFRGFVEAQYVNFN